MTPPPYGQPDRKISVFFDDFPKVFVAWSWQTRTLKPDCSPRAQKNFSGAWSGSNAMEPGAAFLVRLESVMLRKSWKLTTAQPVGPQRRKDVTMRATQLPVATQLILLLLGNSAMSFHAVLPFEIFNKTSRFAKYFALICPPRIFPKRQDFDNWH